LDNVLQPGPYDGGVNPGDKIGTLTAFKPISFTGLNTIDAAIAFCPEGVDVLDNSTPDDGYGIPNSTTVVAYIGMPVQKYGRTTGLTTGTVTAVNGISFVQYSTGLALFWNQIVVEQSGFSVGGDSGSLVVTNDADCNPVGLLFAGSSTTTFMNPIDDVLAAFSGVSIDGK
ncbi:MAG: Nal1-like putative serine protease, partial [Planctomycetota bacterium]